MAFNGPSHSGAGAKIFQMLELESKNCRCLDLELEPEA